MQAFLKTNIIVLLLFALFGCKKENSTNNSAAGAPITIKESNSPESKRSSFDYDATKIIGQVFVTNKKGTALKEAGSNQSEILGYRQYGAKLEVIEELGDWLAIRENIDRTYIKEDGTRVESSGWEMVYVAKNDTGALGEIQLTDGDLNIITSLNVKEKSESFEKGKPLKKYLKLELIDQLTFERMKNNAVNFLQADTTSFIKKNGIITLPTANKSIKIVDKPSDSDSNEEYKYIGQVEFLNQYLIAGWYYESLDFSFFDKTSGKRKQTFGEYPYISADKKNIICIYGNPYDSTSDLELYAITNQEVKLVMAASFTNWFPDAEKFSDIFWSADGYFYVTVIHAQAMWGETNDEKPKKQYLRINLI